MATAPLSIGVCSWSLQVTSVPELKGFMDKLGIDVVQIACGDPHHASWNEGDAMPETYLPLAQQSRTPIFGRAAGQPKRHRGMCSSSGRRRVRHIRGRYCWPCRPTRTIFR